MKIFNWMHRKLLPSVKYGQVSEKKGPGLCDHEKQDHFTDGMMEKEALLVHASLSGILTIGTLGHEEFISQFYCAQEDHPLSVEEEEVVNVKAALEGNEVAPSLVKPLSAINSFKFEVPVEAEGQQSVTDRDTEEADTPLLKEDKEKKERERITLADLLAADDVVVNGHPESGSQGANTRLKQHSGVCTRKKTQNYKKEGKWTSTSIKANNTNTTRKLQELIVKVLKKKIHPETEAVLPNAAGLQVEERKEPLAELLNHSDDLALREAGGASKIGKLSHLL